MTSANLVIQVIHEMVEFVHRLIKGVVAIPGVVYSRSVSMTDVFAKYVCLWRNFYFIMLGNLVMAISWYFCRLMLLERIVMLADLARLICKNHILPDVWSVGVRELPINVNHRIYSLLKYQCLSSIVIMDLL